VQCEYCCGSFDCVVYPRRPKQHMQPDTDPAIMSLFHAERPWLGAAAAERSAGSHVSPSTIHHERLNF
jgi:hypothetical protein